MHEVAEAVAEGDVPGLVDDLVPEQQHGMVVAGPLDCGERSLIEILHQTTPCNSAPSAASKG